MRCHLATHLVILNLGLMGKLNEMFKDMLGKQDLSCL